MFSFLENFSTVRFFFYISFIYFSQPIVCLNKSSAVFCQEAIRHKKEPCTLAGLFLFVFSAQAALAESLAAASEEAASLDEDLRHLKIKADAGVSYLTTQIFLDNNYYYRLLREARKRGIDVPILAGIMPATNAKQLLNMSKMCGCSIPYTLSAMIERFSDDPEAMREVGLNYAAWQIMDLITNGVDGIHLYTMNRPKIATEIMRRCDAILKEFRHAD